MRGGPGPGRLVPSPTRVRRAVLPMSSGVTAHLPARRRWRLLPAALLTAGSSVVRARGRRWATAASGVLSRPMSRPVVRSTSARSASAAANTSPASCAGRLRCSSRRRPDGAVGSSGAGLGPELPLVVDEQHEPPCGGRLQGERHAAVRAPASPTARDAGAMTGRVLGSRTRGTGTAPAPSTLLAWAADRAFVGGAAQMLQLPRQRVGERPGSCDARPEARSVTLGVALGSCCRLCGGGAARRLRRAWSPVLVCARRRRMRC